MLPEKMIAHYQLVNASGGAEDGTAWHFKSSCYNEPLKLSYELVTAFNTDQSPGRFNEDAAIAPKAMILSR